MLNVYADGSAIYPSDHLEATPRYDTGVYFGSGQDASRKDVLELMFRLFDREGLDLTPSLDFSAPLPELEALLRRQGPLAAGLEWVGADGQTWLQVHGTRYGLAPYYNVLNPRVQAAMLRAAREVLTRYASHPSFGGLAIQLSADGFAQLPGAEWGFDDETISQFERDTMLRVPGAGPERFAQRAAFLTGRHREAWLAWRTAALRDFYHRLGQEIAATRPARGSI